MNLPLFTRCRRPLRLAAVLLVSAGTSRSATLLVNGGFDTGEAGWSLFGGAAVISTGDPSSNPYARVPDGTLTLLYQKAHSPAPRVNLTFDYFTGLMSPQFPSPGAFPDTAFATLLFGADEAAVVPEVFRSGSLVGLFDYDAHNGMSALLAGASVTLSPERPGWSRFSALVEVPDGQPWFALTFQNLNANGTAADSAFLVDNLQVLPVPEPAALLPTVTALLLLPRRRRVSQNF